MRQRRDRYQTRRPALSLLAAAGIEGTQHKLRKAWWSCRRARAVGLVKGIGVSLRAAAFAMVAVTVGYLVGGNAAVNFTWLIVPGPPVASSPQQRWRWCCQYRGTTADNVTATLIRCAIVTGLAPPKLFAPQHRVFMWIA